MEKQLPQKFVDRVKPLSMEGVSGMVWDRDTLLEFLKDPSVSGFVILGGDVIRNDGGRAEYTYDNWAIDKREPTESFEHYSKRAALKAIEYIERYPVTDGIFFVPVLTSEATAGL